MNVEANIKKIIEEVIDICIQHAEIEEIILYGSRAKGTHLPKSDIDIALRGNQIDIDDLSVQIEQIETLLGIDLVDVDHCKNELLRKEIEKDGIALYRKV